VATKVLPYYKDYFNIAYPLPKMDLIAISDFSAGAMENWGLVTYRETFVLVDPKNTSLMRKQSIALTVGHEIAHQWFGEYYILHPVKRNRRIRPHSPWNLKFSSRFCSLKYLQILSDSQIQVV